MTSKTLTPPEQVVDQPVEQKTSRSIFRAVGIFIFEMFTVYKHDAKRTFIRA